MQQTTTTTKTETLAKRERVRQRLIHPLERAGMRRGNNTTAKDHGAFLGKLADRLGYMSDHHLERLRQTLMSLGRGKAHDVWPTWVTIRGFAYRFQAPPDPDNPIMQTWLHSVEGPRLRARGLHVAAYRFLRKANRPLFPHDFREIEEAARDDARRRTRAQEALTRGDIADSERAWLADHDDLTRTVDDIIDAGIAHRAEQEDAA